MNKIREAWERSLAKKICKQYPKDLATHKAVFEEGYQAAQAQLEGELQEALGALDEESNYLFNLLHGDLSESLLESLDLRRERINATLNKYTIEEEDGKIVFNKKK